ncbi:MAG: hypothetical protein IT524_05825 [Nitrosomonas sp.]|nr:hypothetical protein [Nitrosomonas sp.]
MEKSRLDHHFLHTDQALLHTILSAMLLALLSIGLYHETLSAGWRFDDGGHLNFAVSYTPWQYFFVPDITRLQSGANLTPWNALFYDINLELFGLDPAGFYAHLLILLWLTSIASYLLLKLWIPAHWALTGSALFLVSAPTTHIANEIMTGHYASGLLFTVIALYGYTRAIHDQHFSWAFFSAFFYLLAVTCKEIYVPLIAILPFLPAGTLKTRLRLALPLICVASAYLLWRFHVLGRLFGGYNLGGQFDPILILDMFGSLPSLLSGDHLFGSLAWFIILTLIFYGLYRQKINVITSIAAMAILLFPLIPLVNYPGVTAPDRYLFLIAWATAMLLAYLLAIVASQLSNSVAWCIAFILTGISLNHHNDEHKRLLELADPTEKSYEFMLNSNGGQFYIAPNFDNYFGAVLPEAVAAQQKLSRHPVQRAPLIPDIEQLAALDLSHASVWRYERHCRCVENVSSIVPGLVEDYKHKLKERALTVHLRLQPLKAEWEFGPYQDGEYAIMLNNQGYFTLPRMGAHSYPRQSLEGYILYKSPEGWLTRSPHFHLDLSTQSEWQWSRSDLPPSL